MSKPEILSKNPITIAELKHALKTIKKRDEELTFRGNKTEEYANQVCSLTRKQSKDLKAKLVELEIPRLKEEHITKVIDVLPKSAAELKVILQGYTVVVSSQNLTKIMEALDDYLPSK